jgi:dihydrofolate reductase
MGKVIAAAAMSPDGYIAKHDNTIGHLFDWLRNGDVECPTATPEITFHLVPQSAEYWREWTSSLGALICGRTLFDFTDGWGGRHTMDVPVFVVTHKAPAAWADAYPDAPFTFVTDGVEAAVERAQAIANDRVVAVTAGNSTCSTKWPSIWCRS